MPQPEDNLNVPEDLSPLNATELQGLEERLLAEFDRLNEGDEVSAEAIARLEALAKGVEDVRKAQGKLAENAEQAKAKRAELKERLAKKPAPEPEPIPEPEQPEGDEGQPVQPAQPQEQPEPIHAETEEQPQAVAASANAFVDALMSRMEQRLQVNEPAPSSAGRLADARRHQPAQAAPAARMAVTAGADIPSIPRGGALDNLEALSDAVHARARSLPISHTTGAQGYGDVPAAYVASAKNEFEHTIDVRGEYAPAHEFEDLRRELVSKDKQQALVAGGGWCAPSEIRYSFYDIGDAPATIDLPTFGVNRGGIQFPSSLSLSDIWDGASFSNTTTPWLWSETDDILTVTGSTNKPCVRVPCPSFTERRLELYGYCVTAGNLATAAYPEQTAHYLRQLLLAFEHVKNFRIISTMVSLSESIVTGGDFDDDNLPVYQQVYGSVALAATDYRLRYGLDEDSVLEVILPLWIREMIRSDLAWRNGVDLLDIPDSRIQQGFSVRDVRVQFVDDWQVRGAGASTSLGSATTQSAWPTSVDFLIYSAGTFLLGNGMVLDLGMVRDSVLNAENDHTAAFFEEAHLVAKVGHESRQYRVQISVNGNTGANAITGDNL